jgi:hypothetical protein
MGWALDWLGQSILFNHSPYHSRSTTVAHWGSPRSRGMPMNSERAAMARAPEGNYRSQLNQPRNDQPRGEFGRPGNGYNGTAGQAFVRGPSPINQGYAGNRSYPGSGFTQAPNRGYSPYAGSYGRPGMQNYAYNRSQQPYARPGYGSGFYGGGQAYGGRPGMGYANPQQAFRAPQQSPQRGYFAQRSYSAPMGRSYMQSPSRPQQSGGFHMFGGGHSSERSYGGGHFGGGGHFSGGSHSGGSGHSGGGGHGGGHHR